MWVSVSPTTLHSPMSYVPLNKIQQRDFFCNIIYPFCDILDFIVHLRTKYNVIWRWEEVIDLPCYSSSLQLMGCKVIQHVISIIHKVFEPPHPSFYRMAFLLLLLSIKKYSFDGVQFLLQLSELLWNTKIRIT